MLDSITDVIKCEIRDEICHIILNNPPSNMMDESWSKRMYNLIEEIDPNSLKGILVYGAGRHFSAGAVLDDIEQSIINTRAISKNNSSLLMSRDSMSFQRF